MSNNTLRRNNIILYEFNETNFNHNGLKVLRPTECIINRNLADYTYDLDMIYPLDDDGNWRYIVEDRIIKANNQLFRIVYTDVSIENNNITIYAKHIFFDLQKNFIEDTNIKNKNGNNALLQLLNATAFEHSYTTYSDITTTNNLRCVRKNVLDALLGDEDNTFVNRWGGEFDVDNFDLKFVNQVGSNYGYKIKYGKNLTGLNFKTDYTGIVTRIRPIGFDGIDLGDDNKYVDSSNIDKYSMPIIKEIKYEHVKWTGSPNYEEKEDDDKTTVYDDLSLAQAELKRLATLEFTDYEIDLPKVTCEINFIELSNTEEYAQFKTLESVSLGDVVTIEHRLLNINTKARCIAYKYDCIKQQYEEITIGHFQKNFFTETTKNNEKINNNDLDFSEQIQTVYAQSITKMTEMMNTSMNGYIVLSNSEILIMDSDDKNTAVNVWKFNSSGIAHSSTGYNGEYTIGMTMDGHINGSVITAGTIKGEMLELETITTRELAIDIQNKINSAMTEETTQALITANLDKFESSLSQTFITEEKATEQIQSATEVAVEQATENIVSGAVTKAMENVNDQLDDKLNDYTTDTLNPMLQNAMDETLLDAKDYVIDVTGNYYTKDETNSIISQTREEIELGISTTYETKEESTIKIYEAIDGVTIGAINRVFGTSGEKSYTFTGINNEVWDVYEVSPDISDKEVIISFEYDLIGEVSTGSTLQYQTYYLSTSNQVTYFPKHIILSWDSYKSISLTNQIVSFTTTHSALQQDAKFEIRADNINGTLTIRKAQIKEGNKITEWSVAPEDIEENANNYTLEQLKKYYTKEQTDSKIEVLKEEISLEVSTTYETKYEVETRINNTLDYVDEKSSYLKGYTDDKASEILDEANKNLYSTLVEYYTKEETDSQIEIAKESITSTVGEIVEEKLDFTIIGGENLIPNSNFNYGFINWNTNKESIFYLTENNSLKYCQTELLTERNYQVYTNVIEVSDLVGKELTLSFNYVITDKTLQTDNRIGYIRFFDEEHADSFVQNDSISYAYCYYPTDCSDKTIETFILTITVPENAKYVRVGAYQSQNGEMLWDNFQLEIGNTATSWKPNSQDSQLYIDSTSDVIFNEIEDISKILAENNGSDSITSAMKLKLISEYYDAIAVYNRLNSMYSALGDTSFSTLVTEIESAKTNLAEVISLLESTISEPSETGLSNVLDKFNEFYDIAEKLAEAISNALTGITKETQTKVVQLADSYNIIASKVTKIGDDVDKINTRFIFNIDGMTIKSTQNATKTIKLDNDSLDFMDNDVMVAQISDEQLTISNAEISNEMKIGSIRIKPSGIGGMMFIYE